MNKGNLKNKRMRLISSGAGVLLSMFVTFVGMLPQPVAAQAVTGIALVTDRYGHTATALQDGQVLIAGGKHKDEATNTTAAVPDVEIVNANDPTSAQPVAAAMNAPRTDHTAIKLANGDVLVAGGSDGSGPLDTTEMYNPGSNSWSPGAPMQTQRSGHTATLLSDGNILIVGGDAAGSAEIYGSDAVVSLNTPRSQHSAIQLNDGKVLIVGGVNNGAALTSAELYDPSTSSFTPVSTQLAAARIKPDLRLLQDGKVQVIGGASDADNGGSFELYDPDANNTKPGFNAKAEAVNSTNVIDDVLNAQTRASIFGGSGPLLSDILNRSGYALTEIAQPAPNPAKVVISGGVSTTAAALTHSAYVLDGSPATITTNATDYAPGSDVVVYTKGWQPNETIDVMLHVVNGNVVRDMGPITWTTDVKGELNGWKIYTPVAPDDVDATFTLTAVGLTSGFVAQTGFTDATNYDTSTTLNAITSPLTAGQTSVSFSGQVTTTTSGGSPVQDGAPVNLVRMSNSNCTGTVTTLKSTFTTSGNGSFSDTFTAPSPAIPTTYYIKAVFPAYNDGGSSGGTNWRTSDTPCQDIIVNPAAAPDLTATKTNSVSGTTTYGNTWDWTVAVANTGSGAATFADGQTILSDSLPDTNVSYGAVSVVNSTGITGTGTISCSISANNLTCMASGGTVVIAATTGAFVRKFTATPTAIGTFANPRSGGSCSVDPNANITESNEGNNTCSDTVTITAAPVTMTAGSYSGAYDGSSHSPSACEVTGTYKGLLTCANNPSSVGPDVSSGAVTPTLVLNGETASNFSVTPVNGNYSITPAPVTMTAGSYSGTYDGSSHSPSACEVTGVYKGNLTCTNDPSSVGPDVSSGAVTPTLVLNGETASNFSVTPVNGSYSITPAPVTMTAGSYSGAYDGSSHSPSACEVTGVYKGNLTCTNNPLSVGPDVSSGAVTPTSVLNGETESNFLVTPVNGSYEISKANLTVTADNANRAYGAANPTFTATLSGFVNGENLSTSGVTGSASCSSIADASTLPGVYGPITPQAIICTQGTLDATNYKFTPFVNGTLTITYGICNASIGSGGVILPPINSDGTSVFQKKRTAPVKFRVCDASGMSISDPSVVFAGTSGALTMLSKVRGTVDSINEATTGDVPDAAFRWDDSSKQWIFNMATNNLTAGYTYILRINLAIGDITFMFGVK